MCYQLEGLHFCEVHHLVVSCADESLKDETRLLLLCVGLLVTLHTFVFTYIYTVTYNRTLPDLKTINDKNWHILQIEPKMKEIFAEPPILALKRNKNLRDIIGGNKVFYNKKNLNV